jgi:hypothetical protein
MKKSSILLINRFYYEDYSYTILALHSLPNERPKQGGYLSKQNHIHHSSTIHPSHMYSFTKDPSLPKRASHSSQYPIFISFPS